MIANQYEAAFLAVVKDLVKQFVVAVFKLPFKTYSATHDTDLKGPVDGENLVEAQFFASVFFEDIPVLNQVNGHSLYLKLCYAEKIKEFCHLRGHSRQNASGTLLRCLWEESFKVKMGDFYWGVYV
jgi:hypothetical protein